MTILSRLRALWAAEPALILSTLVAAIVGAAGALDVVLSPDDVAAVVAPPLAILLGGVAIRSQVTPAGRGTLQIGLTGQDPADLTDERHEFTAVPVEGLEPREAHQGLGDGDDHEEGLR